MNVFGFSKTGIKKPVKKLTDFTDTTVSGRLCEAFVEVRVSDAVKNLKWMVASRVQKHDEDNRKN